MCDSVTFSGIFLALVIFYSRFKRFISNLTLQFLALFCQAFFSTASRLCPYAYTPDLVGGLSQVLSDEMTAYYYGLERLAQQANTDEYEFFLQDRLGSVRQVAGADGFPSFAQEFDPYGSLSGYSGAGSSAFVYPGESPSYPP